MRPTENFVFVFHLNSQFRLEFAFGVNDAENLAGTKLDEYQKSRFYLRKISTVVMVFSSSAQMRLSLCFTMNSIVYDCQP